MDQKPWYSNGLRFECSQCGACCTTHGEYSYIYVVDAEVQAIAHYLGLERSEFEARYCGRDGDWIVIRAEGPSCPFLGVDKRCGIYPVRPKQCRTWPFWDVNLERKRWQGEVSATCPGIGQGPTFSAEHIERTARETEAWYGAPDYGD
jgi:Fe-S-cluster containining protein